MWYYLSHPSRRCFRFLYFDFSAKFVFLFDMVSNFVIRMKLLIGANPLGTFGFSLDTALIITRFSVIFLRLMV